MTLTGMDYFVVLARERSFTKAAGKLYITQQTLSAHIASLEKELGCQLLIRRVPLELTYAGQVFLRYATEFQRRAETMRQEFCDITDNQHGVLRVGVAYTRGRTIMPAIIEQFQRQYPNISVELSEDSNDALHKNLLSGGLDVIIANFPNAVQGVELKDFYTEEVVLLVSRSLLEERFGDGVQETAEKVRRGELRALERCPFVMGSSTDIAGQIGWSVLRRADMNPAVRAKSDNMETLLALCARGLGACFCPENLARATLSDQEMEKLWLFRLGEQANCQIRFGYLRQSYQWSIISEFIRIAQNTVK